MTHADARKANFVRAILVGCALTTISLLCSAESPGTNSTTGATRSARSPNVQLARNTHTASELFLSKQYWERMDWAEPDRSQLWRVPGWQSFKGEQASYATFLRTMKLTILGKAFTANVAYDNAKIEHKYFVSLFATASRRDCDEMADQLTRRFGEPLKDDGTLMMLYYSETNYVKLLNVSYQWDLGQTRIVGTCFGSVNQDDEANLDAPGLTWSMKFAHLSEIKKLTPKFALRCTRSISYLDGSSRPASDMVMWVDPYNGNVTNASHQPLADAGSFRATSQTIVFKLTAANKYQTDFSIDRITGALNAKVFDKKRGLAGTITGTCEKEQSIHRKF